MGTEAVLQSGKSRKKFLVVWFLVLILAALFVAYYLWQGGFSSIFDFTRDYQAVFLSNGQVYFGTASNLSSGFVTLKNVYYLQTQQVLQPVQGQKEPKQVQQISLAKLGVSELHKPKDGMKINRDHILFIEDLEKDSQVIQAINRYEANL